MAIVAGRSNGRRRLLRALFRTAPALCAGCGSSFEEGDETWIRVPGESACPILLISWSS